MEFKKVGWVSPSDLSQSRLKSSHSHHTDDRAEAALTAWQTWSAGTTKSQTGGIEATLMSGKITWENCILPSLRPPAFQTGAMSFPAFLQLAIVLQCKANLPQGEHYIITTLQPLGWTGLESSQTSQLKQPSPASSSWSTISFSYPVSLVTLFGVPTWQTISPHAFLMWKSGDLREMLLRFVQIHKSWSKLLQNAKPIMLHSFFQALSWPFTRPNTSLTAEQYSATASGSGIK